MTNFTYVRVNLIFQRFAWIRKTPNQAEEGKQINKYWESFVRTVIKCFRKLVSQSKTGWT